MVEGDGPLDHAQQRLSTLPVEAVTAAGVVADRDPGSGSQLLDRLDEVAALGVAQERDRVPGRLAAEAVVEALFGVDRERRRTSRYETGTGRRNVSRPASAACAPR